MQGRGLKPQPPLPLPSRGASPLMQGRGLKLHYRRGVLGVVCVAPHAGAWIETCLRRHKAQCLVSPLMQGRGLKPKLLIFKDIF